MKHEHLLSLLLLFSSFLLQAQDVSKDRFLQAHEEITSMLEGTQPLDFEKAIFLTENAYGDDSIRYEDFQSVLDVHSAIIGQLIRNNDVHDWKQFVKGNRGVTPEMEVKIKERYRQALANWAIFTYLTDTIRVNLGGQQFLHLPYTYSNDDPFGTADWRNSQVTNLLETKKGNCYALATLFKIFSERFQSDASIVTAPQHIYIEHSDPHGNRFNVEVATRSFPDMGSIQTLTYTTREALLNDISMRKLDLKQSVGLSLVYLAKGYECKNKVKDNDFLLTCANTALQHDPKNLNALLLKAQMYEQRVMKKEMPSAPYEQMLTELYQLGYRQMPDDMQNIILSSIQQTQLITTSTNKTPNPFEGIGEQARYVTLSNGLFEELHTPQKTVRYGRTVFDTEKGKVVNFQDKDSVAYQVDPVVFALSVDPLTKSYPELTPYQFASNTPIQAIDLDGLEKIYYFKAQQKQYYGLEMALKILTQSGIMAELAKEFYQGNKLTDIYINVSKAISGRGQTDLIHLPGVPDDGSGSILYMQEVSQFIIDNPSEDYQLLSMKSNTFDKGKRAILVHIDKGLLEQVAANPELTIKQAALTIAHEIRQHAIDEKDWVNNVPTEKEHIDFHNDPDFYKINSTDSSPSYEEVKPDSPAGKYKDRIEKAYDSVIPHKKK